MEIVKLVGTCDDCDKKGGLYLPDGYNEFSEFIKVACEHCNNSWDYYFAEVDYMMNITTEEEEDLQVLNDNGRWKLIKNQYRMTEQQFAQKISKMRLIHEDTLDLGWYYKYKNVFYFIQETCLDNVYDIYRLIPYSRLSNHMIKIHFMKRGIWK